MRTRDEKPVGELAPRFHIRRPDGFFRSVPFFFVTERMATEILAERERLTAAAADPKKQAALLASYNPQTRAERFRSILNLFHPTRAA